MMQFLSGDSFSWYQDVSFWYGDFSIFFSASGSSLTSNSQDAEAQTKNTHGLIPGRRRSQYRATECRISMLQKRHRDTKEET